MVARAKKVAYFAHLEECLNKYPRAFLVHFDFVGSKQISDIRVALRGKVRRAPAPRVRPPAYATPGGPSAARVLCSRGAAASLHRLSSCTARTR